MSEGALLDWLCLHLDPEDLPKRFAGESLSRRVANGIKVMAKADEELAAQRRCDMASRPSPKISVRSLKPTSFLDTLLSCRCLWMPCLKQVKL